MVRPLLVCLAVAVAAAPAGANKPWKPHPIHVIPGVPLKPDDIKPYVPPKLAPEPPLEPSDVKVVEVTAPEAVIEIRPWSSPMVGNALQGSRLPVRGVVTARHGACAGRVWYALEPFGYLCGKDAKTTDKPASTESVLKVRPGSRVPFQYVMALVRDEDKLPMWTSLDELKAGAEPERLLKKGDTVAIEKPLLWEGAKYWVSVEGKIIPQRSTSLMGGGSEWHGLELTDTTPLPFGWVTPDHAGVYAAPPQKGDKPTQQLDRRTRLHIVGEELVGKKRYLQVEITEAAPAATYGDIFADNAKKRPGAGAQNQPPVAGAAAQNQAPVAGAGAQNSPPMAGAAAQSSQAAAGAAAQNRPPAVGAAAQNSPAMTGAAAQSSKAAAGAAAQNQAQAMWIAADAVNEVRKLDRPPTVAPTITKWIDVDLGEQVLVAYENDKPVFATLISSGRAIPTPMGTYPVWAKVSAITMKNQPYEDKPYFVNKVPWSTFFQWHNAIHGAYWHDRFGVSKSHGCVNVAPLDARRIFEWVTPPLPPGWSGLRPLDLLQSPHVVVRNSHAKKQFRQDRPIGPPDRELEGQRLQEAEARRLQDGAGQPGAPATGALPPGALPSGALPSGTATVAPPAGLATPAAHVTPAVSGGAPSVAPATHP